MAIQIKVATDLKEKKRNSASYRVDILGNWFK